MESKIATAQAEIIKFIEITAREYQLPPFVVVGILTGLTSDWRAKELVQVVESYNGVIQQLNERLEKGLEKGDEKEDVHN